MTKIIEDQKSNLINFKPEIALPDISLAFQLRESSYEKLEKLLITSCNIVSEHLIVDENKQISDFGSIIDKT